MGTPLTNAERRARYRAKHPERAAASSASGNARRVWVGQIYVGRAPSEETATQLNDEARRHFDRQK